MANRELAMLAQDYNAKKDRAGGMYISEKMDGMRALWIPASRGMRVETLPFANMGKDHRNHLATGLWSRYGKPIFAPDWFLVGFPAYPLDGELYAGRKNFDEVMSACKKHEPVEHEWLKIRYNVFDAPLYKSIFKTGVISNPQFKKKMVMDDNLLAMGVEAESGEQQIFDFTYRILKRDLIETNFLKLHPHEVTPFNTPAAITLIEKRLDEITENDGEGLMLRHPASAWEPIRSKFLLKAKKLQDAEARVMGYRAGQGKYLGMLGSLTVRWEFGTFELSGFTDEERQLTTAASIWATHNPGELLPLDTLTDRASAVFPLNDIVTFRYRELTPDNMPKEGRYLRKYAT